MLNYPQNPHIINELSLRSGHVILSTQNMRRFGMGTISMDIDELLEETTDVAENDLSYALNQIEIDTLLEITRHW